MILRTARRAVRNVSRRSKRLSRAATQRSRQAIRQAITGSASRSASLHLREKAANWLLDDVHVHRLRFGYNSVELSDIILFESATPNAEAEMGFSVAGGAGTDRVQVYDTGTGLGAAGVRDVAYLADLSGGGDPFITPYIATKESNSPYPTIQAAIEAADDAGGEQLVLVGDGLWNEDIVINGTSHSNSTNITVMALSGIGQGRHLTDETTTPGSTNGNVIIEGVSSGSASETLQFTWSGTSDVTIRFVGITFFRTQSVGFVADIQGNVSGNKVLEFDHCRFIKKTATSVTSGYLGVVQIGVLNADTRVTFDGCYMLAQLPSTAVFNDHNGYVVRANGGAWTLEVLDTLLESRINNNAKNLQQSILDIAHSGQIIPFTRVDRCHFKAASGAASTSRISGINLSSSDSGDFRCTNSFFEVYGFGVSMTLNAGNVAEHFFGWNRIHYSANSLNGYAGITVGSTDAGNVVNAHHNTFLQLGSGSSCDMTRATNTMTFRHSYNSWEGSGTSGTSPYKMKGTAGVPSANYSLRDEPVPAV
jgi:hypothetical protein